MKRLRPSGSRTTSPARLRRTSSAIKPSRSYLLQIPTGVPCQLGSQHVSKSAADFDSRQELLSAPCAPTTRSTAVIDPDSRSANPLHDPTCPPSSSLFSACLHQQRRRRRRLPPPQPLERVGVRAPRHLRHPRRKEEIIDDLLYFSKSQDYYKKAGKAWKRGYLLLGPPGTGKSMMVTAMVNLLKYNVYDIELTAIKNYTELRKLLINTTSKSIIMSEDIDCSLDMTAQRGRDDGGDRDDDKKEGKDYPVKEKMKKEEKKGARISKIEIDKELQKSYFAMQIKVERSHGIMSTFVTPIATIPGEDSSNMEGKARFLAKDSILDKLGLVDQKRRNEGLKWVGQNGHESTVEAILGSENGPSGEAVQVELGLNAVMAQNSG
ncbi:P-loop containing nucleoside triphosphate hydrolases superfamily protein [Perilla frutescens var. hirtella]|nr:P-loop containing nucleoside triphosphate hydrolases superfamily protein [Perilla frutescens var. hirtella]